MRNVRAPPVHQLQTSPAPPECRPVAPLTSERNQSCMCFAIINYFHQSHILNEGS